jgi:hypothetical protein
MDDCISALCLRVQEMLDGVSHQLRFAILQLHLRFVGPMGGLIFDFQEDE